ncbi:hypothetical protein [Streptomyces sp. YS415]|uniref:hypothetical protein n=2 Tax=unclassified Streptomyces TaxID=2593676 RepID=UPI00201FDE9E|nr:hypothetical protein [Streptomyces sp. YS415]MCL7426641.1 hypothetical protein [Streptomyces sp. YS415]
MPAELREHAGRHYAVQFHYALPDDAWAVELSEARPTPASLSEAPGAETYMPGVAFVVAVVPDEDPGLEPTVRVHSHDEHVVPYEIMRWFMELVADQVERCRTAFEQEERGGSQAAG